MFFKTHTKILNLTPNAGFGHIDMLKRPLKTMSIKHL